MLSILFEIKENNTIQIQMISSLKNIKTVLIQSEICFLTKEKKDHPQLYLYSQIFWFPSPYNTVKSIFLVHTPRTPPPPPHKKKV